MFPRVVIDLKKYEHNLKMSRKRLHGGGISYTHVTKVFRAFPEMTAVAEPYVDAFGDSRIANIKKMAHLKKPKMLIRLPMHSEAADVVRYADMSLNSELSTVRLLDAEAKKQDKIHKVIIMQDLGDLREGYFFEEDMLADVAEMVKLPNVKIIGVGVNLCCYGGIVPTPENMNALVARGRKLTDMFGLEMEVVSGGGSTSAFLIDDGVMPAGINDIRSGDMAVSGHEFIHDYYYDNMYNDMMILQAEIIELKKKPSIPVGVIGTDAFKGVPHFEDRGVRKRAILAVGRQDIDHEGIVPLDTALIVLGSSSDHTIVDVTDSLKEYEVGDVLSFRMDYGCKLKAATSDYVEKVFI